MSAGANSFWEPAGSECHKRGDRHPSVDGLFFWVKTNGKVRWVTAGQLAALRMVGAQRLKRFYANHPDAARLARAKRRAKVNADPELKRSLYERYKKRAAERTKERCDAEPMFRLRKSLTRRTGAAFMRKSFKKLSSTVSFLGCSIYRAMRHIELQFQPGMNWDNYGRGGWHIDHKIPLTAARDEIELIGLCHFINLQPLWEPDNIRKGASLPKHLAA